MSPDSSVRPALSRLFRRALPWALALAVATCTDDSTGPSKGGVGYFAFRPVYSGVASSLSQFGIVADSVHVVLTRPVNEVVLDTTVFFPPDSLELRMALPVPLEQSPETLTAMIAISAGGVVLFVDTLDVQVVDGPPNANSIATATLDYVGPGNNVAAITVVPGDTTIFFGDTLFYTSTAIDSSDVAVSSYYVAWKTSDTTVAKVNAQGRLIAPNVRGTLRVIGHTPTGIADTADITFAPVPSQVTADSGVAQFGIVGDSLSQLFVARVRAADNLPIEGIHVRFTVSAGGAIRDTLLVTDVNGRVRTRGVLGTTAGAYTYTATIVGTAIATNFTGTASVGAPTAIAISGGNTQVDSAGRALPAPFAVRVADAFNNPVAGVKIYWTRLSGDGALAADSTLTNASGIATVAYTLGAVGTDSVKATLAGTSAFVAFQATAINGAPASVSRDFGDAQSDTVARTLTDSLVVTVRSATSQPVVGTPVVWTVLRGGSTSDDTVLTDLNGRAAVAYTLGTVTGTDSVRAQAGAASAVFTQSALTGAATALSIVSGDAQTDTAGFVLPLPFVVHATDAFGNSVPGTDIVFARTFGTGTLADDTVATDTTGNASVAYTLGDVGTDTVTATLLCNCSTVTFTATAVSAAPASISTVSGDSQTVVVNSVADTFAVVVRDGANNPLPGVKVDWAFIPAAGSFTEILPAGIQSTYTDSLGVARGVYTAGTQVDTVRIEASVAGHIDSLYLFTTADVATSIAIVSGNAQADTVGRAIPLPFVIGVTDAFGNPVSGAAVAFIRSFGSGTLFADTVFTNVNGEVAVGYLFGLIPGVDSIRVGLVGTSAFVDFIATALPATPATVMTQSGDGQNTAAATAFGDSLEVEVRSVDDDPMVNAAVAWTTSTGGVILSVDTTYTDAFGRTFAHVTADTVAGVYTVEATAVGLALPATFTITVLPAAPSLLTLVSGTPQSDTVGSALPLPFVVHATDAYGNATPGAVVQWTVESGTGLLSADSSATDGSGNASVNYVLGPTPATDTIAATLGASTVPFYVTGIMPTPAAIIISSGEGQTATVDQVLGQPLVATVVDGSSNPMVSAQVVWTVLRGGSTVSDTVYSDGSGQVSTVYQAGTQAGVDSVEVRALNGGASAVFTVNVDAGAPATVFMVSGDGQSDTVGKALPLPFVVRVQDAFNNDVPYADVAFARIAGSGALFADTVQTDAAGLATVGYLLGLAPGTDTIRAELVATGGIVDFTATALPATPAAIEVVAGHFQSDTVARPLTDTLVAIVRDGGGTGVIGTQVVWTVLRGGSIDVDTTVTDSLGQVYGRYTLGILAGTDSIEVRTLVGGLTAVFEENALNDLPSAISIVAGDAQTDTAGVSLTDPLVALVVDAYGNPVAGAQVVFAITGGDGSVSDTSYTDGAGHASGYMTLGVTPGTHTARATLVGTSAYVDFTANAVAPTPAAINITSGDAQVAAVGTALAQPFVATVVDGGSNPIVGAEVVWNILRGGSVVSDTVVSDINGQVFANYTVGTQTGQDSIEARATNGGAAALFRATVTAAAPASIAIVSGDGQSDTVSTSLPQPFVTVVRDVYGNDVVGTPVVFIRTSGSGSLATDTIFTDVAGQAAVNYTLGNIPGTEAVRATLVATGDFVDFSATAIPATPAFVVTVGGNGQAQEVGTQLLDTLVAAVYNAGSAPIAGIPLVWTVIRGGSLDVDTVVSDSFGQARAAYTLGTVSGIDSVQVATLDGAFIAVFTADAQAGTASAISLASGDAQVDTAGRSLPLPLVAFVGDAYGNPVVGASVAFTTVAGGGAPTVDTVFTDALGHATVNYTLGIIPGTDTIRAGLVATSAFADFTATGVAAAAASIIAHSGDGQTAAVVTPLTDSLVVQVKDGSNAPVFGHPVVWTMATGGVLSADTTYTDTLGFAWVRVTADTLAGSFSVDAQAVGVGAPATFSVNVLAGTAALIAQVSGDLQVDTTNTLLPNPFVARVTDAYGNPILGAAVAWTTEAGTGSADDDTTFTDIDGLTQVNYSLGGIPESDTIRAELVGTSAFVGFTTTTVAGAPAFLNKILGDGQADTVLATLADSFVVELRSANNSPVPNAMLYWVTGNATLSSDSTLTDAFGRAAVAVTLGNLKIPVTVIVFNADTTVLSNFSIATKAGEATQISAAGGLGQNAPADSALALPFGALVQDAYDNPVDSGVAVIWSNIYGFAPAGLPDTTLTDSTGVAYLSAPLLGPIAGEDSLEATILGTAATATFTAIADPGAAGTLAYVSGTGQSGTVGTMLPTQYNVQVTDGSSNPVPGAWVRWSIIAGNGTFPVDSAQTDGSGISKITLTLGTTAGIDSAIATVDGVADTVVFYAQADAGPATTLALISGDQQAGDVGGDLAAPLVVQVTDQYSNPIFGANIDFGIESGPGGGVATPSTSTDSSGQASSGTVNLAASAGTTIIAATSTLLPADTIRFVVFGVPAGTSARWTGVVNIDWSEPANWAPAVVPTGTDNVYIPWGTYSSPGVTAASAVNDLTIEANAVFDVGSSTLTVNGDLIVDGSVISLGGGHIILAGTSRTARGDLGPIEVTGDYALAGSADVAALQITSGTLTVNGQTLTISGALDVLGTGALRMVNAADSVHVGSTANWAGSGATGLLTAGVIVYDGDMSAAAAASYQASGTHKSVFTAAGGQGVSFGTAGLGGNRFQDVVFQSVGGVVATSDIAAAGNVDVVAGGIDGTSYTAILGGDLNVPGGLAPWTWNTTRVEGSPTTFPTSIGGDLLVTGSAAFSLPNALTVSGNFSQDAGSFSVNGQTLDITGSTTISGTAQFVVASGTVSFTGPVTWDGDISGGYLTGGEMRFYDDLSVPTADAFTASGTNTVRFMGTSSQLVSINNAALNGNRFANVSFENDAGVLFNNSDFAASGVTSADDPVTVSSGHAAILAGQLLTAQGDSTWDVATTAFGGGAGNSAIPDTMFHNVEFNGTFAQSGPLTVLGNFTVFNDQYTVNGNRLAVAGNFDVILGAEFRMQSPSDTVDIAGTATWNGSTADGLLTAGLLFLRGDFDAPVADVFKATSLHGTRLLGDINRTISMASASLTGNRFGELELWDTAGVTLASNIAVLSNAYSFGTPGYLTGSGYKVILGDGLSDPNSMWRPDTLEFAGSPAALMVPLDIYANVVISGSVDPDSDIRVRYGVTVTGSFRPQHHFIVDNDFRVEGSGLLYMQEADDSLEVGGDAFFNGGATTGTLTAGALILRNGLYETSSGEAYQPTGLHQTVFAGSSLQHFNFTIGSATGDRFGTLVIDNPAGVTANSEFFVDSIAEVRQGTVGGYGPATLRRGVLDTTNVSWQVDYTTITATPVVMMDSFPRNIEFATAMNLAKPLVAKAGLTVSFGNFTPEGYPVRVDSGLTITGNSILAMQNEGDSVEVFGLAIMEGLPVAAYMTEGVLALHHGIRATTGSQTFQATANHRTRLMDNGTIDFGFLGDGGYFNHLEIDPGLTITVAGEVTAQGTTTKAAGTATTFNGVNGVRTLHLAVTSIDGAVFDSVALAISSMETPALDNITMQGQDSTGTSLSVVTVGFEGTRTWSNIQFPGVYTSGKMVSLTDASADGYPVRVKMFNSYPLDGSPYEVEINNGDNVYLDWSRLVFLSQPLDIAAATTLAPVALRVIDPDGATVTSFTDDVTLAIGTNPAGGTLSGTLTVGATSGVATFSDLSIDNVGSGYTLDASSAGLVNIGSDPFAITVPLPAGFDVQWLGAVDADWFNAANWSGGYVPGDTTNVYISGVGANAPVIGTGFAEVNDLQLGPAASMTILTDGNLSAKGSVEAGGGITGAGDLTLEGAGTIKGLVSSVAFVTGTYEVDSVATFGSSLNIPGDLSLQGADTLNVTGLLGTLGGTGRLRMTHADAVVNLDGDASFEGASTDGDLTAGIFRISGGLLTNGGDNAAFAPSAGHLTILNGSADQKVVFQVPDTGSYGSHFGSVQVSTTGTAEMWSPTWITGNLLVTTGATLVDSFSSGVAVQGLASIDAGGSIAVSRLALEGALAPAVGSSYSVPLTVYYGGGLPVGVNWAPYDTLQISREAYAAEDLLITGSLNINDGWGGPSSFALDGRKVTVSVDVDINGAGVLVMENAADSLLVTGNFFTNGGSTDGLLTDGWLRIGGGFRQASDGSPQAFRAGPNHTTEFYLGAPTGRSIEFDSPSNGPGASTGSHFGALLMPIGYDTIVGRVPAKGKMFIAADMRQETAYPANMLVGYDSVYISSASPSVQLRTLEVWGGLAVDPGVPYNVDNTRIMGGPDGIVPSASYTNLLLANVSDTLDADFTVTGSLDLGIYCSEVCTSSPGELTVNGHVLMIGEDLRVMGLGMLNMEAGDSVDVSGESVWRGAPNSGHLNGGTLVVRGRFNTVGGSVFQASAGHRTVFAAPGADDIYPTANMSFGTLVLLDGGVRRIRSSPTVVVLDSLILGANTAGLTDTLGFGSGELDVRGPVVTVSGSEIYMDGPVFFGHDSIFVAGQYRAATTVFTGATQPIPALAYENLQITGTAFLTAPIDISGYSTSILEASGPADLDLAGYRLVTGSLTVAGSQATLTMDSVADTLVAHGGASFDGGDETGRLTAGVLQVYGNFAQTNSYSDSSFFASGTHETRFDDSTGTQYVSPSTMFAGASRFQHLTVTGNGVSFNDQGWVGGNVTIPDGATIVNGGTVNLAGALTDPYYRWNIDSTVVYSHTTVLPDSMRNNVIFPVGDTLTIPLLRVGGTVWIQDTFVVNGNLVVASGGLKVTGPGVLQMTNAGDQVMVNGQAEFEGAVSTGLMTEGRLTLNGDLVTGNVTAGSFDPTGNHVTVLGGAGQQSLTFVGGPQGFGPSQFVTYNESLYIPFGMTVKGTFRDSVANTLALSSTSQILTVGQMEAAAVDLTDLSIQMGDQSAFDTVAFHFSGPQSSYALSVVGPGRAGTLDLHAINFVDYDQSSILLWVGDTAENSDQIFVRMFGTTPFNGSSKTLLSGSNQPTADWSTLQITSAFPTTVDSLVAFSATLSVREPDGTYRGDVIASASAGLNANPGNLALNGGTTANFDGPNANFFGLRVDSVATGLVVRFEIQGRAMDFVESAPFDVINPAPAGAVVFTGLSSNDWSDPTNWSTSQVPDLLESVFIPGGMTVTIPSNDTFTVTTLVLGSGAGLDLGGGSLLSVTGNAYAGQTITGAGVVELSGGASQISGTFPTVLVTGNVSAVGRTTITGDLVIDGGSAEFNVGGQKIDVSGTLFTQNSGLLTMDGAADTLYVNSANFAGGDETGRLSDGVLIVQGSNFDQGFGDANSFRATGSHTTIFADGGSGTAVNISDPQSSQFQHVKVQNPNGVDFGEGSLANVEIGGDLAVSAGGIVTGDTLKVDGTYTSDASGSTTLSSLRLGSTPVLDGIYDVGQTWYFGTGLNVAPAPQGYKDLYLDNQTFLYDSTSAVQVTITGGGYLALNGHRLTADTLSIFGGANLLMNAAGDSVIVNGQAYFGGASPAIPMFAGYLEIRGDFVMGSNWDMFQAAPAHVTRFVGNAVHQINVPGEGQVTIFGTVVVDSSSVDISDDLRISGDLVLHDGVWADSAEFQNTLFLDGSLIADDGVNTGLIASEFRIGGALTFAGDTARYITDRTVFNGLAQAIPDLDYHRLTVRGTAALAQNVRVVDASVDINGVLDVGAFTMVVDTNLWVTDSGHLKMNDPAGYVSVGGSATFQGPNSTGDFTAGNLRAAFFSTSNGPSGDQTSFVQTGTHRLVPQAGDTIHMQNAGPAGSMLKTLALESAGGLVNAGDIWISDSLIINGPSEGLVALEEGSFQVVVGFAGGNAGAFVMADGSVDLQALAIGGTLDKAGGSYSVEVTRFIGDGQLIPGGLPYDDVEVQYAAALDGDVTLNGGGKFVVTNTGDLDLNGHDLITAEFQTVGGGQLTMHSVDDYLSGFSVSFQGDSTNTKITSGRIVTQYLEQRADVSTRSYAPSGDHRLVLYNFGSAGDGVAMDLETPGPDASHANILEATDYQLMIPTSLAITDSFLLNVSTSASGPLTIDAYGPVLLGPSAILSVDTLILHDTLDVDPSANYNVNVTIYPTGAQPIADFSGFNTLMVEGDQTLIVPLSIGGDLIVRGSGSLTPDGQRVDASAIRLLEFGRLVMEDAADTVDVAYAQFQGASSNADLASGILRVRNGFTAASGYSSNSFTPTGMVTEFYGGGTASVSFDSWGPASQYFDTLRVIGGTTLQANSGLLAMAPATFKDGSTFDGTNAGAAVDFRYGAAVLDTSYMTSNGLTVFFGDSLKVTTPGNFSVANVYFYGNNGIPDLPYQYLTLGDGVHDTLTHPLTVSAQLVLTGQAADTMGLVLNGQKVTLGQLSVGGYSRITMNNAADTLQVSGNIQFGGEDMSGHLTAGTLRVGADLDQNSYISTRSLRTDGVRVEFYGATSHLLTFASADTSASYIGNIEIQGGGNLYLGTASTFKGRVDVGTSSTLELGTLTSAQADFFGPVTVAASGSIVNTSFGLVGFRDTLLVDGAATYNVINTAFFEIDTIPNLPYQNLYLDNGTNITLEEDIAVTGILSLAGTNPGDQDLTLNGFKVSAGGFVTQLNGRITMTDPGDTLSINGYANFDGGSEIGRLTDGLIQVGQGIAQDGTHSPSSFQSAGTKVEFTNPGLQAGIFLTHPDSSWFTGIRAAGINQLWLQINSSATIKGTMYGNSMNIEANAGELLAVDTVDIGAGTGSITAGTLRTKALLGSASTYSVDRTEITGVGVIPNYTFDTLIVLEKNAAPSGFTSTHLSVNDTLTIANGTLAYSYGQAVVAGAEGFLQIDGGDLTVYGDFITTTGGRFAMDSVSAKLSIYGNALIQGGSNIGTLNDGLMEIRGDFTQGGDPSSFAAQGSHITRFTGGGGHIVTIANPATTEFGELGVLSIAANADTLLLDAANTRAVIFQANGNGWIRHTSGSGSLAVQGLSVSGAKFQGVRIVQSAPSAPAMTFDNVTFSGFSATDIQMEFTNPGQAPQYQFFNVDFDNVADGVTGLYVRATDTDGGAPALSIRFYGPDTTPIRWLALNNAVLQFFPPS